MWLFLGNYGVQKAIRHEDSWGVMLDCYSRAAVHGGGGNHVGGLVGYVNGTSAAYVRIERSYSTGLVTGSGILGGFLGGAGSFFVVADCHFDTQTSGRSASQHRYQERTSHRPSAWSQLHRRAGGSAK